MSTKVVWSHDQETFNAESLGELLDTYGDEMEPGRTVWFGNAVKPSTDFVEARDVLEQIADRAYDVGGEHAEGFPNITDEAEAELSAFLIAWQAKHCQPAFYTVEDVQEYRVTAEDLA